MTAFFLILAALIIADALDKAAKRISAALRDDDDDTANMP